MEYTIMYISGHCNTRRSQCQLQTELIEAGLRDAGEDANRGVGGGKGV